jgi:hypothetical protein
MKTHTLADGTKIHTEKQPNGEWTATDDNYDGPGSPMGWGDDEAAAIADLTLQKSDRAGLA